MNRRIIIAGGISILLIAVLAVSLLTRHTTPTTNQAETSVSYTNAVTRQASTDIVQQTSDLSPGVPTQPGVTIDDIDGLYSYYTTDQAANAQSVINDFLMAHSGLANVHAGVKDNTFTQTGNQVTFTIVVDRPQVSYQVSVTADNAYQTMPSVTIMQVN